MDIILDANTMTPTWPSGVPVTDIPLVMGDTVPLRLRLVNATQAGCVPALAVKQSLRAPDLIMTVTQWDRQDDWYTADWVINTAPLQAALGEADRVALVAELVLVDPSGAQRSSQPIRVSVRRDILPAEYAPPTEVLADWHELISAALASQLPDALQERGVYISPSSGSTTAVPSADVYYYDDLWWSCYQFTVGDDAYRPWRGNRCQISLIQISGTEHTLEIAPDTPPAWLDIYVRRNGAWVLLATSDDVCSDYNVNICWWNLSSRPVVTPGDHLAIYLYVIVNGVKTPVAVTSYHHPTYDRPGRGLSDTPDGEITDASRMPYLTINYMYTGGISVGGIDLATASQVDQMASLVGSTAAKAHQAAAQAAATAKTLEEDILPRVVVSINDVKGLAIDAIEHKQREAVTEVSEAQTGATGAITPLVQQAAAAQAEVEMAEGRVMISETNAGTSAANAATSAKAAQDALDAIPTVDAAGNMTLPGNITANGATVNGQLNANGGVRVPLPTTAREAISYEALMEQQAAQDYRFMVNYMEAVVPSWVSYMIRNQRLFSPYKVSTSGASIYEGMIGDNYYDHVVKFTSSPGMSITGASTGAWMFGRFLGGYRNSDYAAAAIWTIFGANQVSLILGSTSQGYASTPYPSEACYAHPIHWGDYNLAGADYRYPLVGPVNGQTDRAPVPAWQVTTYGKDYLGSNTSCLVRGTRYGPTDNESSYIWALTPSVDRITVSMAPRMAVDGAAVQNRWLLRINNNYVMPMTSTFCGSGHTACLTTKVKTYDVTSTRYAGLRMGGMRIDNNPSMGITNVVPILERLAMQGAVIKPVPTVTASLLDVGAAGGEVTLTVSSVSSEVMYIINDTMCGHDSAAVWCTQSAEQIPSGGGQITLTLAANTTGQPRQVWLFVGHHYGQAAVIKINQSA